MNHTESLVSSKPRLRIAALLSTRPRTLKELADLTGISVQGVLKHLDRIKETGILAEMKVKGGELGVRKVYYLKGVHIGDFSYGDLMVVKETAVPARPSGQRASLQALEGLSEDILVQRVRIREESRRLGKMIDRLVGDETAVRAMIDSMRLRDDEKLVLLSVFTEENLEEAEKALSDHFGVIDARRSIDSALEKVKRIGK